MRIHPVIKACRRLHLLVPAVEFGPDQALLHRWYEHACEMGVLNKSYSMLVVTWQLDDVEAYVD
jgi:hypothetical protein